MCFTFGNKEDYIMEFVEHTEPSCDGVPNQSLNVEQNNKAISNNTESNADPVEVDDVVHLGIDDEQNKTKPRNSQVFEVIEAILIEIDDVVNIGADIEQNKTLLSDNFVNMDSDGEQIKPFFSDGLVNLGADDSESKHIPRNSEDVDEIEDTLMEINGTANLNQDVEQNSEIFPESSEVIVDTMEIIMTIVNKAFDGNDTASTSFIIDIIDEAVEVPSVNSQTVTEDLTVVDADTTSHSSEKLVFVPGCTLDISNSRKRNQSALYLLRHPKCLWKRIRQAVRNAIEWIRQLRTGHETEV